jgi:hypothetical protein
MLGFMKKTVIFAFFNALVMVFSVSSAAHADSAFNPNAQTGSQTSGHLNFSIMIQPSLFLRIGSKTAKSIGPGTARALIAASASAMDQRSPPANEAINEATDANRLSVYGNSGSIQLSSEMSETGRVDGPRLQTARTQAHANNHPIAMTLAASRKIVSVERGFHPGEVHAASAGRDVSGRPSAAARVVYTVAQL